MIIGSAGLILSLALVTQAFYRGEGGIVVPVYLFMFIAFFAFSQGTVIWVFISEIFPNTVRAKGQALGSFTHWTMAVIISWLFPILAESSSKGGGIAFSIFAMILFLTSDIRILLLGLLMALLVAQSRVKSKIHSFKEVFVGGAIGFLTTFLIFSVISAFGGLYN